MNFKQTTLIAALGLGLALSLNACAVPHKKSAESTAETSAKGPVETSLQGCKTELDTCCQNVTPGDDRLLACIYAQEDKLSSRCEYALYGAASQLQHAVAAFAYAAS
jgi:hypothetical protein